MDKKDVFYQEKEACSVEPTHIMDGAGDSPLREIDELYGAADVLSIQNAGKHRRILLTLSFVGTALTLAFLLYDEAELHGLIIACGVMILCLFFIRYIADRLSCHRKYLEYRVLAECLRCQFFLSIAGVKTLVVDLLPWSVREDIPWIREILLSVPTCASAENNSVLAPWIIDQKQYHKKALEKAKIKDRRDRRITKTVFIITIITYFTALLYELIIYRNAAGTGNADLIRALLKIILGTMSAVTLFTGSFYGKMSLSNVIDDHKRMIDLYETVEREISEKGENEELLVFLAREFLNENSTWYAYQSKNGPDFVI
ncbi:MAG: hypothetical protein IKE27_10465 [Oscillospiraceae bacterium]|nr:hypothetical protein [Oscillospiraceae bacterium]